MRTERLLSSTSFRLSAVYAALLASSFALAALGAWLATRTAALEEARPRLEVAYEVLENELLSGGIDAAARALEPRLGEHEALVWRVDGPDGSNLAGDASVPNAALGLQFSDLGEDPRGDVTGDHAVLTGITADGKRLSVASDIERMEYIRDTMLAALFGVGALCVAMALAAGLWATRRTLGRMEALSDVARAFGAGDLALRAPARLTRTPDDIDDLVSSFNAMLDRVSFLVANIRRVSADVAHDLRTPLARVRQRLEAASEVSTPDAHAAAIEAAQAGIDDVLRSFDAMLRLAEIEAGAIRERFVATDVSEVMERVCDAYRPDIETSGRALTVRIEPGAVVPGDAHLLAQAAANLLENAIRYTPPSTGISLDVSAADDSVRLAVSDTGPGIAQSDRTVALEPFKRLDQSRTTPGSGLGLSIVDAIVRLHQATLSLEDNAPGLKVVLVFPRSPTPRRA